jgi:hypothetical protein
MSAIARLLSSLDAITHETTIMLTTAEEPSLSSEDRRELKRRVFAIRGQAQELLNWLSELRAEASHANEIRRKHAGERARFPADDESQLS